MWLVSGLWHADRLGSRVALDDIAAHLLVSRRCAALPVTSVLLLIFVYSICSELLQKMYLLKFSEKTEKKDTALK